MMDAATIRQSFPILFQEVNDEPLVYLDNLCDNPKTNGGVRCFTTLL